MSKALTLLYSTFTIPHAEEKVIQNDLLYTTFLSEYYLKEAFKSIVEVKEDDFQELSIFLIRGIHKIGLLTFRNRGELRLMNKSKF